MWSSRSMKAPRSASSSSARATTARPRRWAATTWNLSNEMMVEEYRARPRTDRLGDGRQARWASPRSPPTSNSTTTKPNMPPAARGTSCRRKIPAEVADEAMALAVRAHQALGCRGVTRTDFRYDDTGAKHRLIAAGNQHPARHDADLAGAGTGRPSSACPTPNCAAGWWRTPHAIGEGGAQAAQRVRAMRRPRAPRAAASAQRHSAQPVGRAQAAPEPVRRASALVGRWLSFRRPMLLLTDWALSCSRSWPPCSSSGVVGRTDPWRRTRPSTRSSPMPASAFPRSISAGNSRVPPDTILAALGMQARPVHLRRRSAGRARARSWRWTGSPPPMCSAAIPTPSPSTSSRSGPSRCGSRRDGVAVVERTGGVDHHPGRREIRAAAQAGRRRRAASRRRPGGCGRAASRHRRPHRGLSSASPSGAGT